MCVHWNSIERVYTKKKKKKNSLKFPKIFVCELYLSKDQFKMPQVFKIIILIIQYVLK